MSRMWLFGRDIDTASEIAPFDNMTVKASRPSSDSLHLRFQGTWGPLSFNDVVYQATVIERAGRLSFVPGSRSAASGALRAQFGPDDRTYDRPTVRVAGDASIGLEFLSTVADPVGEGAARAVGASIFGDMFGWEGNWGSTVFALDERRQSICLRPDAKDAELVGAYIEDRFQKENSAGGGRTKIVVKQGLPLVGIFVGPSDTITVEFRPRRSVNALFVHADVLDARSLEAGDDNAFLFQQALAGGHLCASLRWTHTSWSVYDPRFDGVNGYAQLAILSLRDESSHPVVVEAPSFPLCLRVGSKAGLSKDEPDQAHWSRTNRAVVIGSARTQTVDANLVSIDAIALYEKPVHLLPPLDSRNYLSSAPYWVEDGRIAVQRDAPCRIHGFARNAAIAKSAISSTGVTPVQVILDPLLDDAGNVRFMWSWLDLPVEGLQLESLLVEQATFNDVENTGPLAPKRRKAKARSNAHARIPIIDWNWALSNLASTPTTDGRLEKKGDGEIFKVGQFWLNDLDRSLTNGNANSAFEMPSSPGSYEHAGGHRGRPAPVWFSNILRAPPITTKLQSHAGQLGPDVTALREPVLSAAHASAAGVMPHTATASTFIFGGSSKVDLRVNAVKTSAAISANAIEQFFRRWCGLDEPGNVNIDTWYSLLNKLRRLIVGEVQKFWPDGEVTLSQEYAAGVTMVRVKAFFEDLATKHLSTDYGFGEIYDGLADLLVEEFVDWWNEALEDNASLARTLIYLFLAPPNLETVRRVVASIVNPRLQPASAANPDGLSPDEYQYLTNLLIPQDLIAAAAVLDPEESLNGLLARAIEGVDSLFQLAAEVWQQGAADDLRALYGQVLDSESYQALLRAPADAEAFLDILRDAGLPLWRLSDLVSEPPDYLLISRRIRRAELSGSGDDGDALHPTTGTGAEMWAGRYDLCRLGSAAWDWFLDDDSTVIVKLSSRRGLADILRDADAAYKDHDRPNPLGAPFEPGEKNPLEQLIDDLPEELKTPGWKGVLTIAPTLDLGRDQVLQTLCGLRHLRALWVAVGGRKPEMAAQGGHAPASLDCWAHIRRTADALTDTNADAVKDVGWSLVKFDVQVRGTAVYAGEIAFLLKMNDILGAKAGKNPGWKDVTLSATLPAATGGDVGKPRAFTFAATLSEPATYTIDLAFFKSLALKSVRVGSHQGDVTLDLDADLTLQDPGLGPLFEIDFKPDVFELEDFRIRIPPLPPGEALAMGVLRALSFDLPAIRLPNIKSQQLSLFGLEIKPIGIGLYRGPENEIRRRIEVNYSQWVFDGHFPQGDVTFPYLELEISFGSLPVLGSGSSFVLSGLLGVAVKNGEYNLEQPTFAIGGVDASNVSIDLFRLLQLTIEKLDIKRVDRYDPYSKTKAGDAGVLVAENWDLAILKWPFLRNYRKDLLLAHDPQQDDQRGVLAMATKRGQQASSGSSSNDFFQLQWMLLTRNLDVGGEVKTKLLERAGNSSDLEPEISIIEDIYRPPTDGASKALYANFGTGEWLFGIRFKLGELFDYCTLVLHDGHYYGIGLKAQWLEAITGISELTFAYLPGAKPSEDRFRTSLRIAALEMFAPMRSGIVALEWTPSWDFLIDIGYPWRTPDGYDWWRAFSIPAGAYEAKFGLFIEKRTYTGSTPDGLDGQNYLTLGAGFGFYLGYYFEADYGIAWVRAGIGVFGILSGSATLAIASGNALTDALRGSIAQLEIRGVIGIFAYGEGGVEVWILSARFRVSAQASIEVDITYRPNQTVYLSYSAELHASYSASVRVGSGWFSWTFSVSGTCGIGVHGRMALG